MSGPTMQRRRLGTFGPEVSVVGIGCNAFGTRIDADRVRAVVDRALDLGVTFFDTADVYGMGSSETLLGDALVGRRERATIATKFGMDIDGTDASWGAPGSRTYIRRGVEASLKRLRTDHIDLYQLHQPDPSTTIDETIAALQELVVEGLIGAYGCSNFTAEEVRAARAAADRLGATGFTSAQNEYSLYNRAAEVDLVPACIETGLGLLPYFPLAYGLLTGKYARDHEAPAGTRLAVEAQRHRLEGADFDKVESLQRYADERGISLLDVAVGGLAAQPAVTSVIAGVTSPEQVEANARAGLWRPTASDLEALNAINRPDEPDTHASYRRS
jgi:aryl-alcohol dehydrogenase-like predicted oxidoreductase